MEGEWPEHAIHHNGPTTITKRKHNPQQLLRIRLGGAADPSLLSYQPLGGDIPCLSAVAVQTTGSRGPRDLLVLDTEVNMCM